MISSPTCLRLSKPKFDPGASYLIIGGLSGIGASLSIWMAQRGVRNMVFMCALPLSGETAATAEHLRSMDVVVTHVQGSVANPDDVRRALGISGLPLRGIINSALVLRNKEFDKLNVTEVRETFEPKVAGNPHPHQLTQELGHRLDFFVLLSSMTSICHSAVQASYSSANCFTDEFARFRHKQGLPCTSINFGKSSAM